ncbi:MAG TPA: cyclase family protein [Candidatus Peribacterales bacterium]|nr:cyclase family protein [Candidatus Peribacterales bacterium]
MPTPPTIIDLTHTLSSDTPNWDGGCAFNLSIACDYKDCTAPNIFRTQGIKCNAGIGTHMDAPAHCYEEGKTIDLLELKNLVTDCAVIRVDSEADEEYLIMPDAVEKFEGEHGRIQPNTFIIFYTGWDRYWNSLEKYRNDLKFPSVHVSTAELLMERDISGIGIDTLSPDARGIDFPVHRVILGAGKYIVENIANANDVPSVGAKICVLPMKIKDGTEAPIRLIAFIPNA